MSAVNSKNHLSEEQLKEYWRQILAYMNTEALFINMDRDYMDQLRHENVINDIGITIMTEQLIKPFADMIEGGQYQICLWEVRRFLKGEIEVDTDFVPPLTQLNRQEQYLRGELKQMLYLKQRREDRNLCLAGQLPALAPQYTKESGQAELMEHFGCKDTAAFRQLLAEGSLTSIDKAERWLQYIIANQDHFPQYQATWSSWLSDRKRELNEVKIKTAI